MTTYHATFACMPHPIYNEVEIEAESLDEAKAKARQLIEDANLPEDGWYLTPDNVRYDDIHIVDVSATRQDQSNDE